MSDPAVYNDHREAADVGRRLKQLEEPYRLAQAWRQAHADLEAARDDPELAEMAGDYEAEVARLEEELKLSLVERDPADEKDVIVEIRQGVGGDEAALWAAELQRMLQRYAERRGYPFEQLEATRTTAAASRRACSRSRATAPTRCSSSRAARTASSACPRPSRRAGSTRRPRPSR